MAVARAQMVGMPLRGFDGGLNLRDVWAEIAPNETPLCYNVVFDERGAVASRLGILALNGASLLPGPADYLYYSKVADALLAYISSDAGNGKLYKSTDGGVTWSSVYASFTAGAKGAIVDFNNQVIVCNTLNGVYAFPANLGAPTHTAGGTNGMDEARGSTIVAWKNRVLIGGDPRNDATHSLSRLYACKPADPTVWADFSAGAAWTVDMREIDDQPLTCIGAGQGVDINQKPTLYVCKQNSAYRVNDPSNGSYTTLHASGAGAASATGIATVLGRIVTINDVGIWLTDGIAVPIRVSDKITPLFESDLDLSTLSNWTAGVQHDRVVFNVTRQGASGNNLQLDFHPLVGWITAHKGMSLGPMTVYTKGIRNLIGAAAGSGKVYRVGAGGTDDGNAISAFWSSKDFPLLNGREARLRNLRVWGRGAYNVNVRVNYQRGGDVFPIDFLDPNVFQWGLSRWGDGSVWGTTIYVSDDAIPLEEVGRHFQIAVAATVNDTTSAPKLLDDGAAATVGSFAFYEALLQMVPIGLG